MKIVNPQIHVSNTFQELEDNANRDFVKIQINKFVYKCFFFDIGNKTTNWDNQLGINTCPIHPCDVSIWPIPL